MTKQNTSELEKDPSSSTMTDDGAFERALSFFIGACEAPEVDMWDQYDVIQSYIKSYKKLYWDLLESWADLKVKYGVAQERAYLQTDHLKQTRDALTNSNNALMDYIQTIEANGSSLYYGRKVFEDNRQTITAIDKVLGETK